MAILDVPIFPPPSLCVPYPSSFPDCQQKKVVVQKEENEATIKAEKTQAIADDAQRDLDEVLPMLDAALALLKSLNKNDLQVSWCHATVHDHGLKFVGSSLGKCLGIHDVV